MRKIEHKQYLIQFEKFLIFVVMHKEKGINKSGVDGHESKTCLLFAWMEKVVLCQNTARDECRSCDRYQNKYQPKEKSLKKCVLKTDRCHIRRL